MSEEDRSRRSRWRTVAGVALALLVASVVPSPLRRRPEFGRFGPDKGLHLLGHAVLSDALVEALVVDGDDGRSVTVVAVSTAYSVALGELQRCVPGRAPERADTVAAFLGSVLGVYCWQRR